MDKRHLILSLFSWWRIVREEEELNCVELLLLLKGKPLGYYCTHMPFSLFFYNQMDVNEFREGRKKSVMVMRDLYVPHATWERSLIRFKRARDFYSLSPWQRKVFSSLNKLERGIGARNADFFLENMVWGWISDWDALRLDFLFKY
jgi:hypothetical protein